MARPRGISRRQTAMVQSIPAPVGGLNARDSVANMPPEDAVVLDNWFPMPTSVAVRNGYQSWASGLSAVSTLACYSSTSGARKLFAVGAGNLYDATIQGAVGAPAVTGLTSDWWQHTNFGAAGGQYLVMCNGRDTPLLYNGTTWQAVTGASAPIAITGVTTSSFVHVNSFKGRLFFVEKDSMRAWYLPLQSVGGAAQSLDFSSYTTMGGYLMAMVVWTIDTSGGQQELACFVTSEGEVLVFSGSDPSQATTWSLSGHFRLGHPIGRRCWVRIGSDVALISADGLYPLSQAMLTDRSQRQDAVSSKIMQLINSDVQSFSTRLGWQAVLYPLGNKLIVNVPGNAGSYQYVMNTVHGAWARFTGWNANCWETMGDQLFFGSATGVYLADVGNNDNGASITCVAVQAANYFGTHQQKQFTLARPILQSNAPINPTFAINTDFSTVVPTTYAAFTPPTTTLWGSPWGSMWTASTQVYRNWQAVGSVGFAGAPAMAFQVKDALVTWQSTDLAFNVGTLM